MKNFLLVISLIITFPLSIFAGKWDSAARGIYLISKEPEKALSFVGFLIDLFLMCIPIAIVSGVVSIILKSVFNMDKEDTQKFFFVIGGVLLAISLLIYFFI